MLYLVNREFFILLILNYKYINVYCQQGEVGVLINYVSGQVLSFKMKLFL